ncbi:ribosome maturation factor RimM [Prevotella sp.]|uniref:ribosome maturation factor RimM n=1 Tax=Prevotella sp. TaxID=59823 RepID=UPI002F95D9C5
MIKKDSVYKIGRLGKPHGVKGEMGMMFTDDIFDRVEADYLVLEIDGILVPFFMEEYRFRNDDQVLMKFVDVDTDSRARELTGCDVYFPRALADSQDDATSWAELIGYTLIDASKGTSVGEITHIDDATINVLFEVRATDGREVLIPASEELIEGIDKAQRHIHVRVPEGIFEL